MTTSKLKWVALFTMLIDHIGLFFFPEIIWLRIIGRIAFPILAFTLTHGFLRTHNRNLYLFRLLLFTVIAEIPYDIAMYNQLFYWESQSIMLELFLCFLAIYFLDLAIKRNVLFIVGTVAAVLCTEIFSASYGLYGVAIVIAFYLLRNFRGADIVAFVLITYLFYGFTSFGIDLGFGYFTILQMNNIQLYACLAVFPLVLYNSHRGNPRNKWFFYVFYPTHLIIFYLINVFLGNAYLINLWW